MTNEIGLAEAPVHFALKLQKASGLRPIDTSGGDYSDDRCHDDVDESNDDEAEDCDVDILIRRAFMDFKSGLKLAKRVRNDQEASELQKAQKKDFLRKFGLATWLESAVKDSASASSKWEHHQLLRERPSLRPDESKQVLTKYSSLVGSMAPAGGTSQADPKSESSETPGDRAGVSSKSLSPPMTRKRARLSNYNIVTVSDGGARKSSRSFYDEISFKASLSRKFKKSAALSSSDALKKRGLL